MKGANLRRGAEFEGLQSCWRTRGGGADGGARGQPRRHDPRSEGGCGPGQLSDQLKMDPTPLGMPSYHPRWQTANGRIRRRLPGARSGEGGRSSEARSVPATHGPSEETLGERNSRICHRVYAIDLLRYCRGTGRTGVLSGPGRRGGARFGWRTAMCDSTRFTAGSWGEGLYRVLASARKLCICFRGDRGIARSGGCRTSAPRC